jgi:O-antigen ligase
MVSIIAIIGAVVLAIGAWQPRTESALGRVLFPGRSSVLSDATRSQLADRVIARIHEHPITGSGFERATEAHNVYLQIVDVAGVIGVLAAVGIAIAVVRRPLRMRRVPLVAGGLALVVAYAVSAFAVNTMWDRWLWYPISVLIAAAHAVAPGSRSETPLEAPVPARLPHRPALDDPAR